MHHRSRSGAAAQPGPAVRSVDVLPNGLALRTIALEGTRALTVVVAVDAGSRTEAAAEHGAAHFLEHLVFKGGRRYDSAEAITNAAEHLGASLNAYTSHHLVAFHVTVRSSVAEAAIDLLTDIVGRPKLATSDIERERDVVVQEIARTQDDPSRLADQLVDRAAFDDHALGRPVLGTPASLAELSQASLAAFRARRWTAARTSAFLVGDTTGLPDRDRLAELFGRVGLPDGAGARAAAAPPPPARCDVLVDTRGSSQSHLRLGYHAAIDVRDPAQRAALTVLATVLGGSMGSRLFTEIRDRRGLAYLVYAFDNVFSGGAMLQLSAGLHPDKCAEACRCMRAIVEDVAARGCSADEVKRARSYAAGQLVIAFESSGVVARHAVKQAIVLGEDGDHDASIATLDAVTPEDVDTVARSLSLDPAVACVGPHEAQELR